MAVTYDQSGTNHGNGVNSLNVTLSTAGTNRLLVLNTHMSASGVTSISISGGSLTWHQVAARVSPNASSANGYLETYYTLAPTQLSSTVFTITYNGSAFPQVTAVIDAYSGTDISGTDGAGAIGVTGTGTGSSTAPSKAITTGTDNSLVTAGVGVSLKEATCTAGTNQTINANADEATGGFSHTGTDRQNSATTPTGSVTNNFTLGTTAAWAIRSLELKVAASTAPVGKLFGTESLPSQTTLQAINRAATY